MTTPAWCAKARQGFAWPARASMTPWNGTRHRTWVVRDYYDDSAPLPAPLPILTDVGGTEATPLAWYLQGLGQFVEAAVEAIGTGTRAWRKKPLLAVPLVGTGRGGKAMVAGDVASAIVSELESLAVGNDVDILLVAWTAAAYSAIQTCRTPSLDGALRAHRSQAERLGDAVRADQLVLFLGAGISKPAGLPGWSQLLDKLAREFGVDSLTDARVTERLTPLDRATIVETHAPDQLAFRRAIARRTQAPLHTVAHALVASLALRETVTTNYDGLYEAAVRAAGRDLAVLPGSPRSDGAPWLLKLHGSASTPETIVITRQDYVRYHGTRSALQGIVQAMLLTRHMLFVGFSLTDDNFHAVVDTVRQAVDGDGAPSHERGHFGTALFVDDHEAARVLWRRDIDVIGMGSAGDPLAAARHLEIFLDYLAWRSVTPAAHVLDDAFETLLTERDRAVRDGLRALERSVADPEAGPEYEPIRRLLRQYGAR